MYYTGEMKLIIGLGNPESQYDSTRHNVGFFMLDALASRHSVAFKHSTKFRADLAELTVGTEKCLLIKPTTYYNLVGESVRSVMDFYKLEASDVLIIHDDLALPFGTIRTRLGGSDAGNNGIKSLNQHISETTQRIRIGTWNELRDRMDDVEFVLGKFSANERKNLTQFVEIIDQQVMEFCSGRFTHHTLRMEV